MRTRTFPPAQWQVSDGRHPACPVAMTPAARMAAERASIGGGDPLPEIIALAERVDPDRMAVWEWFLETPIRPHGKTAYELVQAGQGDVVIAFLQRILRDSGQVPGPPAKPACAPFHAAVAGIRRLACRTLAHAGGRRVPGLSGK